MAKLSITNLAKLHEWDRVRCEYAQKGADRILASPRLKEEFLRAKLTETQPEGVNHALTNEEVYKRIIKADQLYPTDKMDELDIEVLLYRKTFSKVVGYTYTNAITIWVNRKYFGAPKGICSNLLHECMHQLGFLHGGLWATSVPYTMNKISEKLWDELCKDIDAAYWKWWYS